MEEGMMSLTVFLNERIVAAADIQMKSEVNEMKIQSKAKTRAGESLQRMQYAALNMNGWREESLAHSKIEQKKEPRQEK